MLSAIATLPLLMIVHLGVVLEVVSKTHACPNLVSVMHTISHLRWFQRVVMVSSLSFLIYVTLYRSQLTGVPSAKGCFAFLCTLAIET